MSKLLREFCDKLSVDGECASQYETFRSAIVRLFRLMFPSTTIDQMMQSPTECAIPFVNVVRQVLHQPCMPENAILSALTGVRKAGGGETRLDAELD